MCHSALPPSPPMPSLAASSSPRVTRSSCGSGRATGSSRAGSVVAMMAMRVPGGKTMAGPPASPPSPGVRGATTPARFSAVVAALKMTRSSRGMPLPQVGQTGPPRTVSVSSASARAARGACRCNCLRAWSSAFCGSRFGGRSGGIWSARRSRPIVGGGEVILASGSSGLPPPVPPMTREDTAPPRVESRNARRRRRKRGLSPVARNARLGA